MAARRSWPDTPAVKAWVETQEAILKLKEHLTALSSLMAKDPAAARNSTRIQERESLSKGLVALQKDLRDIEKDIPQEQLEELEAELKEIKQESSRNEGWS